MNQLKYFFLLPLVFFLTTASAQNEITVDKIWSQWEFHSSAPRGFNFFPNSNYYTKIEDNAIKVYKMEQEEALETLYNGNSDDIKIGNFEVLEDDDLLIKTDVESIYRRSTRSKVYFYDATSKQLHKIANEEKVMYPTMDPARARVAYVLDNDIYVEDIQSGVKGKITNDGKKNNIINGASDWVYEEEFYITQSYEWSPDGRFIAYLKFDESQVPEYQLEYNRNENYPEIYKYKYPKVGENNSVVTLHIYDTESQRLRDLDIDAYYIPRLMWNPAGQLVVTGMNRHQNDLKLYRINPTKAGIDTLLHETSETFVGVHDVFRYIEDGEKFIWQSDKEGWDQLYLYDKDGELLKKLTTKEQDVTRFYGYDSKRNEVVYQAAADAINREILAVNIENDKLRKLESQKGTNSAQFSPTFDYYSHAFHTANQPAVYRLKDNKGEVVRILEENKNLKEKIEAYQVADVEFFKVGAADADSLEAWMIKPTDFDPNKKYPLLMYVYGGPGAQTVTNSWMGNNYWWFQMLADKGVIVVSVDNRGSGGKGANFKKQTYLTLGEMEVEDQISAARELSNRAYIDENRVGIWGWSYGGFMAANSIFKGSDIFSLAISVAPVTHWRWYDTIYTERYMRTYSENKSGYDDNSPINFAHKLEGDFLLIHGMVDDNVHFQHSVELARALIAEGKQFDTYYYPLSDHGIYAPGARSHLYTKMTNFIMGKFGL